MTFKQLAIAMRYERAYQTYYVKLTRWQMVQYLKDSAYLDSIDEVLS